MKNFQFLLACALVSAAPAFAQNNIEVTVTNIRETKGSIRVGLFDNADTFLKKALDGKVVKADGSEVKVVFENLKPGDYAVSVIHDENENDELDTNLVGIPKEGFAFGNNAMGSFGPPPFKEAKVNVAGKVVVQVLKLKYM